MARDEIADEGIPRRPATPPPAGPPPLPHVGPEIEVRIPGDPAPLRGSAQDLREMRGMFEAEMTGPAARDSVRSAYLKNAIAAIDQALAGTH